MNNKGALGAQSMIYVFLFCLILIAGGIVWGVLAFFTQDYDFRYFDSATLTYIISDCLDKNQIQFENTKQFEKEFYTICRLNEKVIKENYLIHLTFENGQNYTAGYGDITQCALADKNKDFPKCTSTALEGKNIVIQTGANQKSRKVRTT